MRRQHSHCGTAVLLLYYCCTTAVLLLTVVRVVQSSERRLNLTFPASSTCSSTAVPLLLHTRALAQQQRVCSSRYSSNLVSKLWTLYISAHKYRGPLGHARYERYFTVCRNESGTAIINQRADFADTQSRDIVPLAGVLSNAIATNTGTDHPYGGTATLPAVPHTLLVLGSCETQHFEVPGISQNPRRSTSKRTLRFTIPCTYKLHNTYHTIYTQHVCT